MIIHVIVPWREVVGEAFMKKFIEIAKAEYYMTKRGLGFESSFNKDDIIEYRKKRFLMRKCGYWEEGKEHGFIGWTCSMIKPDGSLDFFSVDIPCRFPRIQRRYITLSQFLNWKKLYEIENDIEQYYAAIDITHSSPDKPLSGLHIIKNDPDFVPEETSP